MKTVANGVEVNTANTFDAATKVAVDATVTPGETLYARTSADANGNYAASDSVTITVPARPATPSAPTAEDANVKDTSVTLTAVTGCEYSKDNGTNWQDSNEFNDLTANTTYTFVQRVKATDSAFASEKSAAKTITTAASTPASTAVATTTTLTVKKDNEEVTTATTNDELTLTATVTAVSGSTTPTGTVTFKDGDNAITNATGVTVTDGVATATVTFATAGDHNITAVFTPTSTDDFATSTTATTTVTVTAASTPAPTAAATTTTLTAANKDTAKTANTYGDTVTLTATVAKVDEAVPAGTVAFKDGDAVLKAGVAVDTTGKATFDAAALGAGDHSITAVFTPTDAKKYQASTATAVKVTVAQKELTAAIVAGQTKVYDTKATATVNLTLTGFIGKDTGKATATVTFADANVNDKKAISTVSAVTLDDAIKTNYTVDASKVVTEGVTVKVTPAAFATVKAVKPIIIANTVTGAQTLVADLTQMVSGLAGETGTIHFEGVSSVKDTVATTDNKLTLTAADAEKGLVSQTVTVTATNENYSDATVTISVIVTDKTPIANAKATLDGALTYNATAQAPVLKTVTYGEEDAESFDLTAATTKVTVQYTDKDGKEVKAADLKNAGSYQAVYVVEAGGNIAEVAVPFTIAPKALTKFAVVPATMVVGATAFPTFSVKSSDIAGSDVVDKAATYAFTVTSKDKDGKDVVVNPADVKAGGDYTISVVATTIPDSNYTVTSPVYTTAKLTVKAKSSGDNSGSYTPAPSTDTTPVAATVVAASTNPTVKAVLDKIVDSKNDTSVVATFKKSDKKISITATALAGKDVYMYKLVNGQLEAVSSKSFAVDKSGVLTLDNPEAASTTKKATAAADDSVTYVLVPASEKPPVASVSGTVQVAQGNTVLFNVTSGKSTDASFAAGNGAVSETRLYKAYKDGTASYGAYGHGKPGDVTGMYVNGVKLFEVEVVAAPYKSDTTVNITNKKHGDMYWFKITPNNKSAKVAYTAGNGAVLSTRSKGLQKDGSYLFGFQITGKTGDKSGVYVEIDGQQYCVFNVAVK